jgi:phage-related baseplate assembly protein
MSNGVQLSLFGFDSTIVPDIDFCVKDASVVESEVITNYEHYYNLATKVNKTLGRADPVRLFLLTIIYQLVVQRSITDSTGKENLLKYSHGADLDNVGAKWGPRVKRLPPQKALTTLRFTLATTLTIDAVIPLKTLVQTSSGIKFATKVEGRISATQLSTDIEAEAQEAGPDKNGLLPGQINQLVSWNAPFLVSATNISTSSGGSNKEEDDHLRARIWMAPESFSTAGPVEAYESWAAGASPEIIDVNVWSDPPNAGKVFIHPLMKDGVLPSPEICDKVYEIVNADRIRPLTDQVFVSAPVVDNYTPNVGFWIKTKDGQFEADIMQRVQEAYANYLIWQKTKIGRDINPSKCDQMMVGAGAKRTDIPGSTTFIYVPVGNEHVAQEVIGSACTYMGLEDE